MLNLTLRMRTSQQTVKNATLPIIVINNNREINHISFCAEGALNRIKWKIHHNDRAKDLRYKNATVST